MAVQVVADPTGTGASEVDLGRTRGRVLRSLLRNHMGLVGMGLLLIVVIIALFAPLLAPYPPAEVHFETPFQRVGTEGFWLGTSETERVWVQLTGEAGESPYQVQEGDLVDFEGTVEAHDAAFAEQAGVDDAEGAQQLADQAAHLTVAKSAVRLSA